MLDLMYAMEGHINNGMPQAAIDAWQEAGQPNSREICFLLGLAQQNVGDFEAAEASLNESLVHDPDYALALRQLANLKFQQSDYTAVVQWATRYQEFRPYSVDAFNWKTFALRELRQFDAARDEVATYRRAFPHAETTTKGELLIAEASRQYALALLMAGRLSLTDWQNSFFGQAAFACWFGIGAQALAKHTLELIYGDSPADSHPDHAEYLADTLIMGGDCESASQWFAIARRLGVVDPQNYLNDAFAHWTRGLYEEGNKLYRKRSADLKFLYLEGIPEWQGESLENKTILVHSEQGVGDVIQFIRYIPYLKAQAKTVLFNTYTDILSMLKADAGTDAVTEIDESILDHVDYQICMMDVPGYLRPGGITDFPSDVPYLFPNIEKSTYWQQRLTSYQGLKVGLVWAGNPAHVNDHNRSASLAELSMFGKLSGITWFSLQKGPSTTEIPFAPEGLELINLSAEIQDFSDTAAILKNLDLLITVDTSVAHLAGACGLPCWVLLPRRGKDWRWGSESESCQWYPSMRLLTLAPKENWNGLIERELTPRLIELGASIAHTTPTGSANESRALSKKIKQALDEGNNQSALELAHTALALYPDHPDICMLASIATQNQGDTPQTIELLNKVLATRKRDSAAHRRLAGLLNFTDVSTACKHLQTALQLNLDNAEVWQEAIAFYLNHHAPLTAFQIASFLHTTYPSAENTLWLATCLIGFGTQAGESAALNLVQELPHTRRVTQNELRLLLFIYARLRKEEALLEVVAQMQELAPNNRSENFNAGTYLLCLGHFQKGWQLCDQGNWVQPKETPWQIPEWAEEPLFGKHLLICQDHGYGDVIQFFCLLTHAHFDYKVTLAVFGELLPLLSAQPLPPHLRITTVNALAEDKTAYDLRTGLMHWVARRSPNLNAPPARYPYLHVQAGRLPEWSKKTAQDKKLKVGIIWSGNILHSNDYHRSTNLGDWTALLDIPDISWYNLQRDAASNQALEYPKFQLTNIVADCHGMLDTASSIMMLDLVISVDSGIAHLTAALGKPTWILLPYIGTDYRWQHDRPDVPWYPSVRLFRKRADQTWRDVMSEVAVALARLASASSNEKSTQAHALG